MSVYLPFVPVIIWGGAIIAFFAAIHVVPDNALGWLGGQMSNSFGRGTED